MKTPLTIVSGGQTGVDRAALEWALTHRVPHGGWCPKGRLAEDGVIPLRFRLRETAEEGYVARTRKNALDSDGTVIFSTSAVITGGTALTVEFARQLGKPLLHLVSSTKIEDSAARLRAFLQEHRIQVLNVAGPRASQEPRTGRFVQAVLSAALADVPLP